MFSWNSVSIVRSGGVVPTYVLKHILGYWNLWSLGDFCGIADGQYGGRPEADPLQIVV